MINTEGFFKDIYRNARENSVILMNDKGYIIEVSPSFTMAFGYSAKDVSGKHFRMLFTSADRKIKKPETEVKQALAQGSKSDNNFLVHKDRSPIWVMGETVSVKNNEKERYLVKIIHNIHAQKQLERFLLESTEFINTIFNSIKDTSLIILDSGLKVINSNKAFLKMFELKIPPAEGTRLSQLDSAFWKNPEINKMLRDVIVNKKILKNAEFHFKGKKGIEKPVYMDSKLMDNDGNEKKVLLVIKHSIVT